MLPTDDSVASFFRQDKNPERWAFFDQVGATLEHLVRPLRSLRMRQEEVEGLMFKQFMGTPRAFFASLAWVLHVKRCPVPVQQMIARIMDRVVDCLGNDFEFSWGCVVIVI